MGGGFQTLQWRRGLEMFQKKGLARMYEKKLRGDYNPYGHYDMMNLIKNN